MIDLFQLSNTIKNTRKISFSNPFSSMWDLGAQTLASPAFGRLASRFILAVLSLSYDISREQHPFSLSLFLLSLLSFLLCYTLSSAEIRASIERAFSSFLQKIM